MTNVEQLAHVHWWARTKLVNPKLQADLCLGAQDPAAQLAYETTQAMWLEVKDTETEAMRTALGTVTLAAVIG